MVKTACDPDCCCQCCGGSKRARMHCPCKCNKCKCARRRIRTSLNGKVSKKTPTPATTPLSYTALKFVDVTKEVVLACTSTTLPPSSTAASKGSTKDHNKPASNTGACAAKHTNTHAKEVEAQIHSFVYDEDLVELNNTPTQIPKAKPSSKQGICCGNW